MGTHTTSIACNNCGAALQVSDTTRFVTCAYCNSQLAVHRTDSAAYTEVLHAVKQNTDRLVEEVNAIRLQNELEALERKWEKRREGLMVRGKDGSPMHPLAAGWLTILIGLIGGGVSIYVFGGEDDEMMPVPGWAFGIFFMSIGILSGGYMLFKASLLSDAEEEYKTDRRSLLKKRD